MRLPSICLDDQLAKYLEQFRSCFSKPQYKYFVTILLGLLLCQSGFTLTGILRSVSQDVTPSGTSRFLSQAPWSTTDLCQQWQTAFQAEMIAVVQAEHAHQRARQPKRRGRPRKTVVTGYLIGDDSVMQKRRSKKMGGAGRHFSHRRRRRRSRGIVWCRHSMSCWVDNAFWSPECIVKKQFAKQKDGRLPAR